MNEPTLHPNLAKLAAAYDEILDRIARGQVTSVAARAEIAQLEARDDQGVRWNIDPDTGEWVRTCTIVTTDATTAMMFGWQRTRPDPVTPTSLRS